MLKIRFYDRIIFKFLRMFLRETSTIAGLFYKGHRKNVLKNAWSDYWFPLFESFVTFYIYLLFGIWSIFKFSIALVFFPITVPYAHYKADKIKLMKKLERQKYEDED